MNLSPKRLNKLASREYRQALLREVVVGWVVNQIKALRKQRGWTQEKLAIEAQKPQSVIARLENESYGNWSTNTLLEIASAFDVALEIRFVAWPKFLSNTDDTSPRAMRVQSFSKDQFLDPLYRSREPDSGISQVRRTGFDQLYRDADGSGNLPSPQQRLH